MPSLTEVFFYSLSPVGESKVILPIAFANAELDATHIIPILLLGVAGNALSFPITYFFMNSFHKHLWKYRLYKKFALFIGKRSQRLTKNIIGKYGFWGLMAFVAIPIPTTGAYMGAIISWIMRFDKTKAFFAVTGGVFISASVIASVAILARTS